MPFVMVKRRARRRRRWEAEAEAEACGVVRRPGQLVMARSDRMEVVMKVGTISSRSGKSDRANDVTDEKHFYGGSIDNTLP